MVSKRAEQWRNVRSLKVGLGKRDGGCCNEGKLRRDVTSREDRIRDYYYWASVAPRVSGFIIFKCTVYVCVGRWGVVKEHLPLFSQDSHCQSLQSTMQSKACQWHGKCACYPQEQLGRQRDSNGYFGVLTKYPMTSQHSERSSPG